MQFVAHGEKREPSAKLRFAKRVSCCYICAMKPIDLGLIQARRKKIEAEMQAEVQRHQSTLRTLEDELEDLIVAERVFSKLSGSGKGAKAADEETDTEPSSGKPPGLPAMPEMIREALVHAVSIGAVNGLKPAAILSYVRGKYWAGAASKDVGPIAWRMWQNDQLEKYEGGEYALLDSELEKVRAELAKRAAAMTPPKPGEFDLTGKLNP
jgi:hypothetical protein